MEVGIIGTSIWQQNLPLIETLTIDREVREQELARLKKRLGLSELVYVATCNRVEFAYVCYGRNQQGNLLHRLLDFFFRDGRQIAFFPNDFYHYTGKEAIRHLFRTVCSLESLVVGETQITGQFIDAAEESANCGLSGPTLGSLVSEARQVAKRVRRETEIGRGAVSMASLAASTLCSELSKDHPRIALIGTGPMTLKCAAYLKKNLSCDLVFVNRTFEKAKTLAEQFDGSAVALDEFLGLPGQIDAVISATAARGVVLDEGFLARVCANGRNIVCIDLAIPRDFSDAFAAVENITLVDIGELRAREQRNVRNRFVKVSRANEIVQEEVERFVANRIEVTLKPIFHQSYQESITMAEQALNDLFEQRALDEESRRAVQRLVHKLLGHSCFQPARLLSDHLANRAEQLISDEVIVASRESA